MTTTAPTLVSIHVGLPRTHGNETSLDPLEKPWTSAIFKQRVQGPVVIHADSVEGDAQADRSVHGGPDKAICVYSADHYARWQSELGLPDMAAGGFGENFTIAGLTEDTVCIGDRWSVGSVVVEVSQPRQPCWKLARRWRRKEFAQEVIAAGRTGWYFRVVRPDIVNTGDRCTLVARPYPEWTIAAANRVMHGRPNDRGGSGRLAAVGLLSESWQNTLRTRS
jgi:MOSC domain-containing protein YiiM